MKIDEKGQVLIVVTLSFVVLALFAGLAVDIGTAYLLKARLSRVVDAAALAAAKALKGQEAFKDKAAEAACDAARMNGLTCGDKANINVEFVPRPVEGGPNMLFVQIKGSASVPTTLLRLLSLISAGDFSKLSVKASAEAGPERPVDLMLVLDRSLSMNEVDTKGTLKINALKTAVNEFLNNNFSANDQIGMVSFATRGCGNTSGTDSTVDGDCTPDKPLQALTPPYLTDLQDAVSTLVAEGGTNTMEALRTARKPIQDAFGDLERATSRKVVLLVTDGQPTFMRRFNESECKTNPRGGSLPTPGPVGSFPSGCLFGVPGWTSDSFWPKGDDPGQKPGMFRNLLSNPNDFVCAERRIPPFKLEADDPCGGNTSAALYRGVIAGTRSTQNGAMFEANEIRNLGDSNVLIFAIAIGKDTSSTDPQNSLDFNAKCLLARIANAKEIENAATGVVESMTTVCNAVFTTTVDGDTHLDIKENWPSACTPGPPCIDSTQKVGRVFLVDMSVGGEDVTKQLKQIFAKVAALLKIRLTM